MAVAIDNCTPRVRVRDAHGNDVKANTIKEKEKEEESTYLIYMEMFPSQNPI